MRLKNAAFSSFGIRDFSQNYDKNFFGLLTLLSVFTFAPAHGKKQLPVQKKTFSQ
jgi:hypothetical protein